MTPEQVVDCFNDKSQEFVSDLCRLVPTDADFRTFKTSLRLLTAVDPVMAIRLFAEHVSVPYRQYIIDRDDAFFLSEGFRDAHADNNVLQSIIAKVGEYWTQTIRPDDRQVVWSYMELLHVLADKYADRKTLSA